MRSTILFLSTMDNHASRISTRYSVNLAKPRGLTFRRSKPLLTRQVTLRFPVAGVPEWWLQEQLLYSRPSYLYKEDARAPVAEGGSSTAAWLVPLLMALTILVAVGLFLKKSRRWPFRPSVDKTDLRYVPGGPSTQSSLLSDASPEVQELRFSF